jgi:hypothetical protein
MAALTFLFIIFLLSNCRIDDDAMRLTFNKTPRRYAWRGMPRKSASSLGFAWNTLVVGTDKKP